MIEPNLEKANNTYVSFQTLMFFDMLPIDNNNQVIISDYDKTAFDDDLLVGNGTPLKSQYSNSDKIDEINNIPLGTIDNILSTNHNYGACINNSMYYYCMSHHNIINDFSGTISGKQVGDVVEPDSEYQTTSYINNSGNNFLCSTQKIILSMYDDIGNFIGSVLSVPSTHNSDYFYEIPDFVSYYRISFIPGTNIYSISETEYNNLSLYFESDIELGDYYLSVKQNCLYEVDFDSYFPQQFVTKVDNKKSYLVDMQLTVQYLDTNETKEYTVSLNTENKSDNTGKFIFNSGENTRIKVSLSPVEEFPCYLTNIVVKEGIDRVTNLYQPVLVCSELAKLYKTKIMYNQTLTFSDLDHDSLIYKIMQTPMASQAHGLFVLFQLCMLELSALQYAEDNDPDLFSKFSMRDLKRLLNNLKCIAYYFNVFPNYIKYIESVRTLIIAVGYFKNKYSFKDTELDYRVGYYNDI